MLSITFVYVFILLGYIAKRIFKDEMDTKTLTLFSVYFLQAFVTMWGFSTATLSSEHLFVPIYYIGIICLYQRFLLLENFLMTQKREPYFLLQVL